MEAILFFILLVVALLVLNVIDMISKNRGKPAHGISPPGVQAAAKEVFTDSTGRPLHGPALARARAAQRAAARATLESTELKSSAES